MAKPDGSVVGYDKNGTVTKLVPTGVKTVEFRDGKMVYKNAQGNVIGESSYSQGTAPSGTVRAEIDDKGNLTFFDLNNNKIGTR